MAGTDAPPHGPRDVVRVAAGNFLEMYDFTVYGYFAAAIGQAYFPAADPTSSLLQSLATFGAGFLMRPVGAVVLGAYADRHGRRTGLLLTLALMGCGILVIAATPTAATIGLAAPLLVLGARLVQGFSAGAELGSVSVFLAEIAPPGRRGFWVAWQSASQQVAVIAAALVGLLLAALLTPAEAAAWGWRVPLAAGCLLLPVLALLRRHLRESAAFTAAPRLPMRAVLAALWAARGRVALGTGAALMTTVSFYSITAFTPTFGRLLRLPATGNLVVTALVGLSNLAWVPLMGWASDRVGRRPVLVTASLLAILTAYPAMRWLVAAPSVGRLALVLLWLSALYGSYNGAAVAFLTEVMPSGIAASGFSLAYSLAVTVGGFSPFAITWAGRATGEPAVAGLWIAGAAAASLAAVLALTRRGGCPPAARAA